jgi:uncharacterized membrane protein YphA (DoxX/SURF4 family)
MKKNMWVLVAAFVFGLPAAVSAHVAYVITPEEVSSHSGMDWGFVLAPFRTPSDLAIMFVTIIVVAALLIAARKIVPIRAFFDRIVARLASYNEYIPWIIRLALGIALIGAGTAGVLISPTFAGGHAFAFVQFALGFCFLMGFLIVPSALVAIGLFLYGAFHMPYLIGNADFLALAVGVFVYASARPGVDDILQISMIRPASLKRREWIATVVRLGLGVAFVFLALHEKLLNPGLSDLVVSQHNLTNFLPVSENMWVLSAGLVELALGLLIIVGVYTRLVAVVSIVVISLTFFFFKEAVYSHVTLFSALAILAIEGGGRWSLDRKLRSRV